jgi:hypothetical protein
MMDGHAILLYGLGFVSAVFMLWVMYAAGKQAARNEERDNLRELLVEVEKEFDPDTSIPRHREWCATFTKKDIMDYLRSRYLSGAKAYREVQEQKLAEKKGDRP